MSEQRRGIPDRRPPAPAGPDLSDPRVVIVLAAARDIAAKEDGRVSVKAYDQYRKTVNTDLPATTTIYRLFGSWGDMLAAAGLTPEEEPEERTPPTHLVDALTTVATKLGVRTLSSHAYDEYRQRSGDKLPSSSVIRKWHGSWEKAVREAGLEVPQRAVVRRIAPAVALQAVRRAKRRLLHEPQEVLTQVAYQELSEQDPENWPSLAQILSAYPNWEAILQAADIENDDDLTPTVLWTMEEARRVRILAERWTGARLNQDDYERMRQQARRPLPSYQTLVRLLAADGADE